MPNFLTSNFGSFARLVTLVWIYALRCWWWSWWSGLLSQSWQLTFVTCWVCASIGHGRSISSATSSSVTFSSAANSAKICSSSGKISWSCSPKLAFYFSSSVFLTVEYSSCTLRWFSRGIRDGVLLLSFQTFSNSARRTVQLLRNLPLRLEYLRVRWFNKQSGPYLSHYSLYCVRSFVHHNRSKHSTPNNAH